MQRTKHESPGHSPSSRDELSEHLPEWVQLFGELKQEAEEAYPDGRVRVIIPRHRKRHTEVNRPL